MGKCADLRLGGAEAAVRFRSPVLRFGNGIFNLRRNIALILLLVSLTKTCGFGYENVIGFQFDPGNGNCGKSLIRRFAARGKSCVRNCGRFPIWFRIRFDNPNQCMRSFGAVFRFYPSRRQICLQWNCNPAGCRCKTDANVLFRLLFLAQ